MKLIIITGLPATGKTSLGQKISQDFRLPFYSKDTFKEIIFDYIGTKEEIGKNKIAKASYEILYCILEQNLKVNNSVIVESNFIPEFSDKVFNNFKKKYKFDILQIKCETEGKILFDRFKERSFGKDRHPGHDDKNNIEAWKDIMLEGKLEALNIGGKLIKLDTSNFENIDYNVLYSDINEFLK